MAWMVSVKMAMMMVSYHFHVKYQHTALTSGKHLPQGHQVHQAILERDSFPVTSVVPTD